MIELQDVDIRRMYEGGAPLRLIAEATGTTAAVVRAALVELGVEIRRGRSSPGKLTKEAKAVYAETGAYTEVAKRMGCSPSHAKKMCDEAGLPHYSRAERSERARRRKIAALIAAAGGDDNE